MIASHRRASRAALSALLAGTVLTGAPVAAQTATADDNSHDIVVTATKREESLQKVPISIQALSAKTLEQHQVNAFDDYAKLLPSVSFQSFGPGQSQIYFRGITSGGDGQHNGSQPTSALYVDEIPLTTIAGSVDLHVYDMERVEALAGPQGTLFGSSSLAGTLRLITKKPTHKFEAGFDISGTSFGKGANSSGGSFDGFINVPISPSIALRASAFYQKDGGYITNLPGSRTYCVINNPSAVSTVNCPNSAGAGGASLPTIGTNVVPLTITNAAYAKKNFNDVETYGGRAALGIDLAEGWTVTPQVIYQHQNANGSFLFGPNAQHGDRTIPSVGDLQVQDYTPDINTDQWTQAALTIKGKIGTWDITYAGGYFDRHVDNIADYSAYSVQYMNKELAAYGTDYYNSFVTANGKNLDPSQRVHGHDNYTKQSHELRVNSPVGERFRLTAGMFYERQTDQIFADYQVPGLASTVPPSSSFFQTAVPKCGDDVFCSRIYRADRDYAMFADASVDLLSNLTLTGGIRGFIAHNTSVGFSGGASKVAQCITPSSDPNTPCILFDRAATEAGETHKINLSWKADRDHLIYATYSTGYRPGGINRLVQVLPYKADTITNYEVGFKTAWLHRKLYINLAFFDEEWKNVQYGAVTPNSNGVVSTYNVGNARSRGVEGDVSLSLGALSITGSGSYVDAKLTTPFCFIAASGPLNGNPDCSLGYSVQSGTALPIQPKFKGNLSARYKFNLASAKAYVQATASHQSGTRSYLDDANAAALGPTAQFTTVDFAVGADMGKWHWEAFINNAFDERGILSINTVCAPSICGTYARAYPTKPQYFGLKVGAKF